MLKIVRKMGQLPFSALMGVYEEENLALGRRRWPREPESRQLALAEEVFREYLETVFFRQEGALYALWLREDRCVSALRLEPYRDGLLLDVATAMTTAHVRVKELFGKDLPGGRSVFTVKFEVKNVAELDSVRNRLLNIRDVIASRRGQN